MDIQAALEWCDQVMAKVDGERMAWSQCLDRISFAIGMAREVPLVYYADGERYEIGTAQIQHDDGLLTAAMHITSIKHEFLTHPIMRAPRGSYSISIRTEPPAEVSVKPIPAKPASSYSFGFGEGSKQWDSMRVIDLMGRVTESPVSEFRKKYMRYSTDAMDRIHPRFSTYDRPFAHYSMMPDGTFINNLTGKPVFTEEKDD